MKSLMTKKLNQVLALVLTFMALLAVGFTISFSACTQQQAKHYDKSEADFNSLSDQAIASFRQNNDSALMMLDSLQQHDIYPAEIIEAIRGDLYSKTAEIKASELSLRKALNESLYQRWRQGYYRTAFILATEICMSDNLEGALRIATDAYTRISTETDPALERSKWYIMSRIGLCRVRLNQVDEAEDFLEKTYTGLKAYALREKDDKAAYSLCLLCTNVLADYIVLAQNRMPVWFDRMEEALSLEEQFTKDGAASPVVISFRAKTSSLKAQYLGAIGKLKEAKEAFDEASTSDYFKSPSSVIDKFNYYYFSKQWDKAAELLYEITYYHYHTVKVEPTLTSLCELGLSFRVYENAGRNADAMEMGRMMANMVDSARYYHMKDQAAEMAALYETKEKDAEIAQQQIELSHQRLFGLAVAIVLLTIFFVVYTIIRRRAAKRLAEMKAAQERIESELRIARDIQMSMVPSVFPQSEGLDMYASMTPAKEVGGDLYGYLMQDNKLYFAIGDVSGKGVPASLFMAQATRLFLTLAKQGMMPAEICTRMNDALSGDDNASGMFVTFWLGLLDLQTGHLDFCNAGHNPPVIGGGDHQGDFLEMLPNAPIGLWPGLEYEGEQIDNIKGRALFIYTDGLNEAENTQQEQFGDDRLLSILRDTHFDTAQQVIETLKAEVEKHRNGAEPNDDLTMMCLRVK